MGNTPPKGQADFYSPGDFNAVCSMCGRKRKASTMEKNWQGLYRCPAHNDQRQPQDFVRGVVDNQSTPWAQNPGIQFVGLCTINTQSAFPGIGLPGCMIPGNNIYHPTGL
jgi:poly(3-hydroxybutyrate) depolymerase